MNTASDYQVRNMETGLLLIEDDNQLFLIIPGKGRIALPPGAAMEIRLGGYWIAGHYWPDLDEQDRPVGQHDFKDMEEASFCGLTSGMKARIDHETRKEASNVHE